jgi:predicted transposase YbfD/YdcC
MPTDLASSQPTIDSSDSNVTILATRLKDCFSSIQDHRSKRTLLYQLSDILTIAVLSVIAGGNGWEDMALYGLSKYDWLSTFLALPNGIPSPDTFRRVFEEIRPSEFERCFEIWVQEVLDDLFPRLGALPWRGNLAGAHPQLIAIDGKEVRGSYDREAGTKSLHLVSAWSTESQLVLAQTKVQSKSNEITAIPILLDILNIEGSIITIDAMGTQKKIADKIHQAGGDYILSLKANHPTLFQDVNTWFKSQKSANTLPLPIEHTTEAGHHRIEIRKYWTFPLSQLPPLHESSEWSGFQTIIVVERLRHLRTKTTHEIQFYLSSLSSNSSQIAKAVRQHWGIENSLHWVLDVNFNEDACRVRSLHAPHNLALVRRFALNILNCEQTFKASLKQKSKRAAMDNRYMLTLLASAFPPSTTTS